MEWLTVAWILQQLLCGLPAALMSGAGAIMGVKNAIKKINHPDVPV
jgi:hypothetical protein